MKQILMIIRSIGAKIAQVERSEKKTMTDAGFISAFDYQQGEIR